MAKKMNIWFIGLFLVALLITFMPTLIPDPWMATGLLILFGFIVGIANVKKTESLIVMVAIIGLSTVSGILSFIPTVGAELALLFGNISAAFGGTLLFVALRALVRYGGTK